MRKMHTSSRVEAFRFAEIAVLIQLCGQSGRLLPRIRSILVGAIHLETTNIGFEDVGRISSD